MDNKEHEKLITLIKILKLRPDPPAPSPMTIPLKADWIWSSGTLWSGLAMMGPSAREMWNDCCGCGAGWTEPEQHAWVNISAFVARLTSTETKDLRSYAVWALRDALEDTFQPNSMHHQTVWLTNLSLGLTVAYVWVEIAGSWIYERRTIDETGSDINLDLRGRKLPWYSKQDASSARWRFWRRRFEQEPLNEKLSAEVREQASEAAKLISSFEGGIFEDSNNS